MSRFLAACAALVLTLTLALTGTLAAGRDVPGDFDFYVLSLSWSPTYCAFDDNPDPAQCNTGQRGFIVHGLWPQYERGYPENCRSASLPQRIPEGIAASVRDLMPSRGLVFYEWRKHGICSGLYPDRYFALLRRAAQSVKIPPEFAAAGRDRNTTPQAIEAAFSAANPGLSPFAMAAMCGPDGFTELRVCLDKDLRFRRCPEVERSACRASRLTVPGAP